MLSRSKQPAMPADTRYEHKCVVEFGVGMRILDRLGAFMRPDRHSDGERGYEVTSLYVDTPQLAHYHDVISGELRRVKFRLRKYHPSSSEVSLEAKHKLNRLTWKDRVQLEQAEALDVVSRPWQHSERAELAPFTMPFARERHVPTVTVAYRRIALEELLRDDFRATLDFDMRAGAPEMFDREWRRTDLRMISPGLAVLELKFRERLPTWCARALDAEQLSATVFSKYLNAIDRCYNFTPRLGLLYKGGN
jgi:hypothetical protein